MPGKCSATDVSGPLNGSPTPRPCLWHDKTMEVSRLSRFGMTCEPLTAGRGQALLTSWLAGFHVRTSALPEKAQASKGPGQECGPTWRGSLARFDRNSSSWKTAQLSLLGDSELSSVIWPRSGMTAGGQCWELPMLERRTSGTGCGFLPNGVTFFNTPNTAGLNGGSNSRAAMKKRAAAIWPTPTASQARSEGQIGQMRKLVEAGAVTEAEAMISGSLRPARMKQWPTPTVCGNHNRKGASATSGDGLATAVATSLTTLAGTLLRSGIQPGGQLSADWTEWLMGWPIGHTGLKPLEMGKSRNAPQRPSECSSSHSTEVAA